MDLDQALRQFDLVDANLRKLETVWERMRSLVPQGVAFINSGPEGREYRQLGRDFRVLIGSLPAIDGWRITAEPLDLDTIGQMRFDAQEIDEIEALVSVERVIDEPDGAIEEYRSRFTRKRRELVRSRLNELVADVDAVLDSKHGAVLSRSDHSSVRDEDWERMEALVAEIDRLLGDGARTAAWSTFQRHLRFAKGCDLLDIEEHDWPTVKAEVARLAYDEGEPLPSDVEDLGQLVAQRPAGGATTRLNWSAIDDDGFERLIFEIISDAAGYENPKWLMKTRAPDRGRDLSVDRVRADSLSGVARDRVILQCKHWRSNSVTDTELADAVTKMRHWEPPAVHALVVVTSGRFTADAVRWAETHNADVRRPHVELWAESDLERMLAARPRLAVAHGLR